MHCPRAEAAALLILLSALPAVAQEEAEEIDTWSNQTELALVQTTGNSESFTGSLKNKLALNWERSSFVVDILALRTESTNRVLTNEDGEIVETSEDELIGEQYGLSFQYNHRVSERTGWFSRGGWQRNRPAGINNRFNVDGGMSRLFLDNEVHLLRGEGGFGFAYEEPLEAPTEEFPTARALTRYERHLSATSSVETEIELIENLDNTDDLRINFLIGVTAKMTDRLALKLSYSVFFDNEPVTEVIEGDDPGEPDLIFVFDKTDTLLAASLVIDF